MIEHVDGEIVNREEVERPRAAVYWEVWYWCPVSLGWCNSVTTTTPELAKSQAELLPSEHVRIVRFVLR